MSSEEQNHVGDTAGDTKVESSSKLEEPTENKKEEVLRLELFFNEVNCLPHLAQFSNLSQVIFFGTGKIGQGFPLTFL